MSMALDKFSASQNDAFSPCCDEIFSSNQVQIVEGVTIRLMDTWLRLCPEAVTPRNIYCRQTLLPLDLRLA